MLSLLLAHWSLRAFTHTHTSYAAVHTRLGDSVRSVCALRRCHSWQAEERPTAAEERPTQSARAERRGQWEGTGLVSVVFTGSVRISQDRGRANLLSGQDTGHSPPLAVSASKTWSALSEKKM